MGQIIKVTSKGQITIPSSIRERLDIDEESYIAVDTIGDYIIMKKVGLKLREISALIGKDAKKRKITRKDIERAIKESREEVWTE